MRRLLCKPLLSILGLLLVSGGCAPAQNYQFGDLTGVPMEKRAALHVPAEFQVLSVNGENLPELYAIIGSQVVNIQLPPGDYEI